MKFLHIATAATLVAAALPSVASAAPTLTALDVDLLAGSYTFPAADLFDFGDASFTFGAVDDPFNPLTVQTTGSAAISSFGGFLGIPVTPSSSFTNRGTVEYGPASGAFSSFPDTAGVSFSNGGNFLGLRVSVGADNYYGFAYTQDNVLLGYGFETAANTAITATTDFAAASGVPEPASWAMMIAGFALAGASVRRARTRVRIAFA